MKIRTMVCAAVVIAGLMLGNVVAMASGGNGGGGVLSEQEIAEIMQQYGDGSSGENIANAALKYVGLKYSQELRNAQGYVDCSSLTQRVMSDEGIDIPGTSVEQANYYLAKGSTASISEAETGDLVFWTKTNCVCGRSHEIHHVGIYLGGGAVVEASSSKNAVVVRKLWETENWKIAFCAKASSEMKPIE